MFLPFVTTIFVNDMRKIVRLVAVLALLIMPAAVLQGKKPKKKVKPVVVESVEALKALQDGAAVDARGLEVVAVSTRSVLLSDGNGLVLVPDQQIVSVGDKVNAIGTKATEEDQAVLQCTEMKVTGSGDVLQNTLWADISETSAPMTPVKVTGVLESRIRPEAADTRENFYVYIPDARKKTPSARVVLHYPDWNGLSDIMSSTVDLKGYLFGITQGDIPEYRVMVSSVAPAAQPLNTVSSLGMLAEGTTFRVTATVTAVARKIMTLSDFTGSIQMKVPDKTSVSRGMRLTVKATIGKDALKDPSYSVLRGLSYTGAPKIQLSGVAGSFEGTMKPTPGGYVLKNVKLSAGDTFTFPEGKGFRETGFVASSPAPLHGGKVSVGVGQDGIYDIWYFPEPEVGVVVPAGKKAKASALGEVESDDDEGEVIEPSFKDKGIDDFKVWMSRQIKFPKQLRGTVTQGVVTLGATVTEDGTLTDVHVIDSTDPLFAAEALRAARTSPKWTPATRDGEPIEWNISVPVIFLAQ